MFFYFDSWQKEKSIYIFLKLSQNNGRNYRTIGHEDFFIPKIFNLLLFAFPGWPNITNFSELKKNLEPTLNLLVKTSGDLCKKEKNTEALSNNYVKKKQRFFFSEKTSQMTFPKPWWIFQCPSLCNVLERNKGETWNKLLLLLRF